MTHDRPYQRGIAPEQALDVVRGERGRHFDPQVVDAFVESFGTYSESLAATSDERARAHG
jgi:putative two-component system response regulator